MAEPQERQYVDCVSTVSGRQHVSPYFLSTTPDVAVFWPPNTLERNGRPYFDTYANKIGCAFSMDSGMQFRILRKFGLVWSYLSWYEIIVSYSSNVKASYT